MASKELLHYPQYFFLEEVQYQLYYSTIQNRPVCRLDEGLEATTLAILLRKSFDIRIK